MIDRFRMLKDNQIARTFEEAIDGVLTDLLRFATYRSIGFEVDQVADAMNITLVLAEHYEADLSRLMKGVNSEAAPDATGAAPDPQEGDHHA